MSIMVIPSSIFSHENIEYYIYTCRKNSTKSISIFSNATHIQIEDLLVTDYLFIEIKAEKYREDILNSISNICDSKCIIFDTRNILIDDIINYFDILSKYLLQFEFEDNLIFICNDAILKDVAQCAYDFFYISELHIEQNKISNMSSIIVVKGYITRTIFLTNLLKYLLKIKTILRRLLRKSSENK